MSKGVQCDRCGHLFKEHSNTFGKVCTRCGYYIEPLNNPIEKDYDDKLLDVQQTIRSYLKQHLKENNNAN